MTRFWRRAVASPAFVAGAVLTLLIVLAAVFAPQLAPYSPTEQDLGAGLLPPSPAHPFGTDQLGRDVLSRVLYAARTDLGIAALAAIAPLLIGVTLGLVSGYLGRATDWVISRITDTVIAFPFYVLVIALVFALGAGPGGIVVAFAIVGWVGYARVVRALTQSMREQGWVRAARGAGLSNIRVITRHLLPNVLPQIVVLLASELVLIMVAIVTLGFLGLGVRPPTPDWGTMIADGQSFVTSHWWLSALPGVAVVITGIALSLLGDGVADALRVTGPAGRAGRRASRGKQTRRVPRSAADPATPTGTTPADAAPPRPGEIRVDGLTVRALAVAPAADTPSDVSRATPVSDVTFHVQPGEAFGIVGESGSGKSLTLRAIAGLLPRGLEASATELGAGGAVGMVFQDPLTALDPLTRVGTQLREACAAAASGVAGAQHPADRVLELLEAVQLPDAPRIARAYPHELSGGQRQRIVIAMALAGNPAVLLADEPTTALDVTVQREVLALLDRLRRERGLTLVLVSHDLAVVGEMCERIVVMRHGSIVEAGSTRDVLLRPEHPYTRALLAAVPALPATAATSSAADPAVTGESAPGESVTGQSATGASVTGTSVTGTSVTGASLPAAGLELRDVAVRYGNRLAVSGISFGVTGALGLVGESGSGKSTIARAIVGELPLAAGTISFDGAALPARRSAAQRRAIQLIPQDPGSSLNPRRTIESALTEVLRATGARGAAGGATQADAESTRPGSPQGGSARALLRTRAIELLELVGLGAEHAIAYPHELSGGQRQRVAIARALAAEPELIIADEATSALDVSVQAEIIALLARLRRDLGLRLIVISHDLAVVHELCDDVVVLRAGRIVEHSAEALIRPAAPYTRELLAAVPRLPA